MKLPTAPRVLFVLALIALTAAPARAQSADWQAVIWREPQVRYLLADMTGGGKVEMYRDYATREKDPDSIEAIRLWDAGVRAVNLGDFERRWVTNMLAKDGRAFRVVFRGTSRTITGTEVLLSNDGELPQAALRFALLDLTLGTPPAGFAARRSEPAVAEALRRFAQGCRVSNAGEFARTNGGFAFKASGRPADPAFIRLNSDVPYPEVNVRYFMADVGLGGSLEFYRKVAEDAHEMGCLEAVRRIEEGYRVTNLDEFERKRVEGKVLITRKDSNERISGTQVRLSSDLP